MLKGIVFDIKRYAVHDGPGIRTTVFFKGCPARCWWCHNPESQMIDPESYSQIYRIEDKSFSEESVIGKAMTVSQVMKEIKKDVIFADESGGGVTFSGGEPLMQPEFLIALLKSCRKEHIHTVLDTTGHAEPDIFTSVMGLVDLILFDIKIMDDGLHHIYTGLTNNQILTNLNTLAASGTKYMLRYPIIPGYTDSKENIERIKKLIIELQNPPERIDLLPFHDLAKSKYHRFGKDDKFSAIKKPDQTKMNKIRLEFIKAGLETGIGG